MYTSSLTTAGNITALRNMKAHSFSCGIAIQAKVSCCQHQTDMSRKAAQFMILPRDPVCLISLSALFMKREETGVGGGRRGESMVHTGSYHLFSKPPHTFSLLVYATGGICPKLQQSGSLPEVSTKCIHLLPAGCLLTRLPQLQNTVCSILV